MSFAKSDNPSSGGGGGGGGLSRGQVISEINTLVNGIALAGNTDRWPASKLPSSLGGGAVSSVVGAVGAVTAQDISTALNGLSAPYQVSYLALADTPVTVDGARVVTLLSGLSGAARLPLTALQGVPISVNNTGRWTFAAPSGGEIAFTVGGTEHISLSDSAMTLTDIKFTFARNVPGGNPVSYDITGTTRSTDTWDGTEDEEFVTPAAVEGRIDDKVTRPFIEALGFEPGVGSSVRDGDNGTTYLALGMDLGGTTAGQYWGSSGSRPDSTLDRYDLLAVAVDDTLLISGEIAQIRFYTRANPTTAAHEIGSAAEILSADQTNHVVVVPATATHIGITVRSGGHAELYEAIHTLPVALSGLMDVSISNPVDGAQLTWNASTQRWYAKAPTSGGGGGGGGGTTTALSYGSATTAFSQATLTIGQAFEIASLSSGSAGTLIFQVDDAYDLKIEQQTGGTPANITSLFTVTETGGNRRYTLTGLSQNDNFHLFITATAHT